LPRFFGTTDKFLAAHRFLRKAGFQGVAKAGLRKAFPVMAVDAKLSGAFLNYQPSAPRFPMNSASTRPITRAAMMASCR
jgi:hypothetical protein